MHSVPAKSEVRTINYYITRLHTRGRHSNHQSYPHDTHTHLYLSVAFEVILSHSHTVAYTDGHDMHIAPKIGGWFHVILIPGSGK